MQDTYAFDVGDFGKLGLLRFLTRPTPGEAPLRLGVIWYLNDRRSKADDGKHLAYLDLDRSEPAPRRLSWFAACDPELYAGFRSALGAGHKQARDELAAMRSVARLEQTGLLPTGTSFFGDLMGSARRPAWFAAACGAVAGSDIVFCDPDNGIEGLTSGKNATTSSKHMALAEVADLYGSGHSLVLYHHLNRDDSHASQVERGLARLRLLVPAARVLGVRFHRGTSRVFYVVVQPRHSPRLEPRQAALARSPWVAHGHMTVYG